MNMAKVKAHIQKLAGLVDNLDETLKPLMESPESMAEKLPLLDRAKFYAWYIYTIEAVLFAALQTCSVDPQAHPLKKEILRIKEHFAKISAIESAGAADPRKPPTLNKEAVARVLKHDLGENSTAVKRRLDDIVAKERANSLLVSLESETPASATENKDGKRPDEPAMRPSHHHMETRAKTDHPLGDGNDKPPQVRLGTDKNTGAKIDRPLDNGKPLAELAPLGIGKEARAKIAQPAQLGNDKKGKTGRLDAPHDPCSGLTKNLPRCTLADAYTKPSGERSQHLARDSLETRMAGISMATATEPRPGQSPKKDVPPGPGPAPADKVNQKWDLASALGLGLDTDPSTCYQVSAEDKTKQAHANIPGCEGPKCPEKVERHEQQVNTTLKPFDSSRYGDRKPDGPLGASKSNPDSGRRPEGPEGERPATCQEKPAPPTDPSEEEAPPAEQRPMRGGSASVASPSPDPGPKLSPGEEPARKREKPRWRSRKRQRHGQ